MLTYDTMIANPKIIDEPRTPQYKCYLLMCFVPILLIILGIAILVNWFTYKNNYDDMSNISSYNITHNYEISEGYNILAVFGLLSSAFLIACLIMLCLISDKCCYYCHDCCNDEIEDFNIISVV